MDEPVDVSHPVRRVDIAVIRRQSVHRIVCAPVMGAGALAPERRDRCQLEVNSDSFTETSLQQNKIQPIASHRSTGIPMAILKASSVTLPSSSTCSRRHEQNVVPATPPRSSSSSRCFRVWASTWTRDVSDAFALISRMICWTREHGTSRATIVPARSRR